MVHLNYHQKVFTLGVGGKVGKAEYERVNWKQTNH